MIRSELVVRHPPGSSPRRRERATVLVGAVVWAATAFVVFAARSPRMVHHGETKAEIARQQVREYASSAFLMWVKDHPDQECPDRLVELNEYTNRGAGNIADAWGRAIRMACGGGVLRVWSVGEDGEPGTADDIRSWE
jgi:hypothetical protein